MTNKAIKIIGLAATAVSLGATLVNSWVGEKRMESEIAKKVSEAVAKTINNAAEGVKI